MTPERKAVQAVQASTTPSLLLLPESNQLCINMLTKLQHTQPVGALLRNQPVEEGGPVFSGPFLLVSAWLPACLSLRRSLMAAPPSTVKRDSLCFFTRLKT